MKKVTVIGLFCLTAEAADGQSIKTRIVAQAMKESLGADHVNCVDTYGWKKNPVKLLINCIRAVWNSSAVVFMTDAGGIKVFPWLLHCANIFAGCKLHYVVVGGWLVHYLPKHRFIAACLKRFDGIFVETRALLNGLNKLGFDNLHLMPNFKELKPLNKENLCYCEKEPYRFCTFSRVMQEKGIAEAVKAIEYVNAHFGRTVCALDIYGQIDPGQTEWFQSLEASFPEPVRYCGIVPFAQSVDVIKDYHALLFPTKFYTEGIPGTIIDAYAAGVPVVASRWEGCADVVDAGITGLVYPFDQPEMLKDIVLELVQNPDRVFEMKVNCLKKAEQYLPETVIDILLSRLF